MQEQDDQILNDQTPLNQEKSPSPVPLFNQIVQLGVVVLVLALLAYLAIKMLLGILYWLLGIFAILVLIINRQIVLKIIAYLRSLYQKHLALGLVASLGAILAFTPFVGLLFLKTIWDFRNSDLIKLARKTKEN